MSGETRWSSSQSFDVSDTAAGSVARNDCATAADNDAVRAYLAQIGRVPLLTPAEERTLCRQIEAAHAGLAAALLAEPSSGAAVAALSAAVRRGAASPDDLLQSPDGGSLTAIEVDKALIMLSRASRRAVRLARIDEALAAGSPSSSCRQELRRRADRLLDAIGRTLVEVPLQPAFVETLAAEAAHGGGTAEAVRRVLIRLEALRA